MKSAWRVLTLAGSLFCLFSLLIVQFFKLQILEHDKWVKIANQQHQVVLTEPAQRGVFFANTDLQKGHSLPPQPLVYDVLKYHAFIDPQLLEKAESQEIAARLAEFLELPDEAEYIEEQFHKKSRARRVGKWLAIQKKEEIEQWWQKYSLKHRLPFQALFFVRDYKRLYPFGPLLGQVLHTVRDTRDERTQQAIPTGGLEQHFNPLLRGREGKRILQRAPKYTLDSDQVLQSPQRGCDIHLTINHIIQRIVEEELEEGVQKVRGKAGWAVMMNPYTGAIYAMAHYPPFNPGQYAEYYNDDVATEYTKIKAISDNFEPGSTMKPISLAIAMLANEELMRQGRTPIFSPEEMIRTDNPYFPGRTRPLKDVRPHKYLNMALALQKSSNIYPARLVQLTIEQLGADWYRKQLEEVFGFGLRTHIELPYENPGMVPRPGKLYTTGQLQWSNPTPYSLAIGYNLQANTIQMLRAFAILANGGYSIKPTLIRKIVQEDQVLYKASERPIRRVLSEKIVQEVVSGLKYVTKPGGSAVYADIPGYTEAGKTSTSEKLIKGGYSHNTHFSSFIGFAPVFHPAFVLMVAVDEPESRYIPGFGTTHFGGKCSAPIFREIGKRTLKYLGIKEDDPYGYPQKDPRFDATRADWYDKVRAQKEIYEQWNEAEKAPKRPPSR